MIFVIVLLPIISFITVSFFSRYIGRSGATSITTFNLFICFILSSVLLYSTTLDQTVIYHELFSWISIGTFHISWGFLVDPVTSIMLIVITSISTLVHLYSIEYMKEDPHLPRFMSYLSLFTFFMLMLVTATNFLQMFFGWEGVGLASYLLINFWHTRIQANKSAIKAIVMNRIGDLGLIVSISSIYYVFHSLDYLTIFSLLESIEYKTFSLFGYQIGCITFITLSMFVGCIGKSAQLGLHTWLPDAMEGPTPVSALIHAATMVTAGVFLLVRCSPLIEYSSASLVVITLFGGLTAIFAATVALVQNDLKKVIAYSTCSQLGYMVFCCGLSAYPTALFHLTNHAFFKALLFLSAGSVIHAISDEQDFRKMGGLVKVLPFTYSVMLIGSLSLMGFPFLTGYYSKDLILEIACGSFSYYGRFVYWMGCIAAFFTAFYSIRAIYLAFLNAAAGYKSNIQKIHEPNFFMSIPFYLLAICSIFVGYFFRDMFVGLGSDFWNNSIMFSFYNSDFIVESEFLPIHVKMFPVFVSCFSASLSFYLYTKKQHGLVSLKLNTIGYKVYKFLNYRWYVDAIYNTYIGRNVLIIGYEDIFKTLDRGYIEKFGSNGLKIISLFFSKKISNLQTGYVYNYMLGITIGSIIFIFFFLVNIEISFSILKIFLILFLLSTIRDYK